MEQSHKQFTAPRNPPLTEETLAIGGHDTQRIQIQAKVEIYCLRLPWKDDVEDVYPAVGPTVPLFLKDHPNPCKLIFMTALTDAERMDQCWGI